MTKPKIIKMCKYYIKNNRIRKEIIMENTNINNKTNTSIKTIVQTALFTSIIVILSQIAIPMPFGVPITLQTFAVALCGYVLGWKYGTLSTLVYVLLGAVGLPVFANFSGGMSVIFGMTGGFIFGFLVLAALSGLHIRIKNKIVSILLGLSGLIICHVLGVIQFSFVTNTPFVKSLFLVSIPFLLKDVLSVIAAYLVAIAVRERLNKANLI